MDIEKFLSELTSKYNIKKESLFGTDRHKRHDVLKARKELIIYLKSYGLSVRGIAEYLMINEAPVYTALKKPIQCWIGDSKASPIIDNKESEPSLDDMVSSISVDNKALIKALLDEKTNLEKKLQAVTGIITMYMGMGLKF